MYFISVDIKLVHAPDMIKKDFFNNPDVRVSIRTPQLISGFTEHHTNPMDM
jgi:hypothetical protein